VLAGLANSEAECESPGDLGEVLYAVRIDPLARLEKLKAAAGALQVAESREMPGWKVEAVCSGLDGRPHTIKITTPTGHSYLSRRS
jgi:hypothetical protein